MLINLRKIIYFIFIINIFSNCSIIYAHDINYKELFPNICITEQKISILPMIMKHILSLATISLIICHIRPHV